MRAVLVAALLGAVVAILAYRMPGGTCLIDRCAHLQGGERDVCEATRVRHAVGL